LRRLADEAGILANLEAGPAMGAGTKLVALV